MADLSNLALATREMIDDTWSSAVSYGMPLLKRIEERGQFIPGGTEVAQIFEAADYDDLVQEYGENDPLVSGRRDIMAKAKWKYANFQVPVEETLNEAVMNAAPTDEQLVSIRDKVARAAVKGLKHRIAHRMYGCATDQEIDQNTTLLQGVCSALLPPTAGVSDGSTYGGIARTTTANLIWAPADYANTFTATTINKYNLDAWMDSVLEYAEDAADLLVLMGPTLYNRLKAIFEACRIYQGKGNTASQGFESMEYNGVEIAKDPVLDRMTPTGRMIQGTSTSDGRLLHRTAKTYAGSSTSAGLCGDATYNGSGAYNGTGFVFVLNLATWHFQYRARYGADGKKVEGAITMTDFFDQSKVNGGKETMLARVKFRGNLTCDMPNQNLMRANVQ